MDDLLNGRIKSSTALPERGLGMPSVLVTSKEPNIESLILISNNVYADIKNSNFRELDNKFHGTFYYLQLDGDI
jgi:hypothetical protein